MSFNEAAIDSLFGVIVSAAEDTGYFDSVNTHEPKSSPGNNLHCAIWLSGWKPVKSSGLDQTSGLVTFFCRVYNSMLQEPQDDIDPNIAKAASALTGVFTGNFDFGDLANVRSIDLLGAYSNGLSADAGYMQIGNQMFRVMVVNLPIIVDNMWVQNG